MAGEPPTQEPRGLIHPKIIWDGAVWVYKKVRHIRDDADDVKKSSTVAADLAQTLNAMRPATPTTRSTARSAAGASMTAEQPICRTSSLNPAVQTADYYRGK
jgi:hypothetical protein